MPAQFNVPANPLVPVMLEVRVVCEVANSASGTTEIINIYHFAGRSGNGGSPDLSQCLLGFQAWHDGNVAPCLSVDFLNPTADIRIMDDPFSLPSSPLALANGVITGDRLPTYAAVSFDLVTDARGRCFRGRKHYAPIAESGTTLDQLTGATLTAFSNLQGSITPGLHIGDGSNNFDLCVLSTKNSVLIGSAISFTYAIVKTGVLNDVLGTMKRRKQGVGV